MGPLVSKVIIRTGADLAPAALVGEGVMWLPLEADCFYFVSDAGEIASLHKTPGRILKPSLCGEYRGLKVGGVNRHVHRLVAETFYGPRPGMVVRHLDGDKMNNRLSNLAWGSHTENMADMRCHGTSACGERNGQAKLTRERVKQMREQRARGLTFKAIAQRHGVATMTAHRAITGGSWK